MQFRSCIALIFLFLFTGMCSVSFAQKVNTVWVHGDTLLNSKGFYGVKGVANKRNNPGRRSRAAYWTDNRGDFWLYGGAIGYQFGASGNDLWKWDGTFWTWISGDSTETSLPNYGAKGVPAASNSPGAIQQATCAYHNGNLFLFGGIGFDKDGGKGYLNNLWVWDGTNWTWLSGSAEAYAIGVLGTKGQISPLAVPGARYRSNSIVDADGNFWLYGGFGQYTFESSGDIDDLWMWDGENWIWMSGSGMANQQANYGTMNVTKSSNSPGGRGNASLWFDEEGNLEVFAGETTSEAGGGKKYYADIWEWDGKDWTWISGDTNAVFSRHNTLYTYDSTNRIGHRRGACHWQDGQGNIWVFGGVGWGDHSNGMLNDLWKWDGTHWYWMGGGKESSDVWHYGEKGVASDKNWPKARMHASFWMDRDNHFWMYGGTNTAAASGLYGDLWKFDPQFKAKLVISGNDVVIEDGDTSPTKIDQTDFGKVRISGVPIRKTFVVANHGNLPAYMPNTFAIFLRNGNGGFRVLKQPSKARLEPGDTLHFTLEFDPVEAKLYEAEIVFRSNTEDPEYFFKIQGRGTDLKLITLDNLQCSSINLQFVDQNAEHYTLLMADSGSFLAYPTNGENYNYSPNYSKAPRLTGNTRIIYQGSKREVRVTGLISGRSYQAILVPGDGLPGNTIYYRDSASIVYFKTPGSFWKDSVSINPTVDTGSCPTDTLIFDGSSPFALKWMDGVVDANRMLGKSGSYYFTTEASDGCLLSSDTIELSLFPEAEIYSIQSSKQPWCEGDTVELRARTSHTNVWSNGGTGSDLLVTESGTYTLVTTTDKGCAATDSVSVLFNKYPVGEFLADTFWSVGDEVILDHTADGNDVQFDFEGQVDRDFRKFVVTKDGPVHLYIRNGSGCASMDAAFVVRRELVLRAFPNAFSPNGDGLNENWFFIHEADSGQVVIFDRWGEVIHVGSNAWDGMLRGEVVPVGEYFFRYEPYEGDREPIMGSIKVIR